MFSIVIPSRSLFIPSQYGKLGLIYKEKNFYVLSDGSEYKIENCFLSPILRSMTQEKLSEFLKTGFISISKCNDDYVLRAHTRGLGGGPVAGAIGYWLTKAICYGTAVTAASATVVATGGIAGAATGAAMAAATASATVGTGAGILSGAITGAGLSTQAICASTLFVASVGSIGGSIATVESTALGVGAALTAMPFLP